MSPSPKPPGVFSWHELATRDASAAKTFYPALFGWTVHDDDMGEMGTYTRWLLDGEEVGAMHAMQGPMFEGVPPHWLNYVSVASVDETVEQALGLGGRTMMPPMDVPEAGRMAVVADPTGASLGLWQAGAHHGKADVAPHVHGFPTWCELVTDDVDGAGAFHAALFGWTLKTDSDPAMPYTEFMAGDVARGGMIAKKPEMGPVPSHWSLYVAVDDCGATAARAAELGAVTHLPPMQVPGVGTFASFGDPTGAAFAVIQFDPALCGDTTT